MKCINILKIPFNTKVLYYHLKRDDTPVDTAHDNVMQQVKEFFPDLGSGFIDKVVQFYDGKAEDRVRKAYSFYSYFFRKF